MLKKSLKRVLLFLSLIVLSLMFAGNALAASKGLEQDADPYHVILQTNPETVVADQQATFTVTITDKATGKPVTGAKVMMETPTMNIGTDAGSSDSNSSSSMSGMDMSSSMDKQGGSAMQEQSAMGSMSMAAGTYMMEDMSFNQPGQWMQAITISSSLGDSTVNFPINVVKSGPNYVLIGSVAGVVVLAGILAAVLRKRNTKQ